MPFFKTFLPKISNFEYNCEEKLYKNFTQASARVIRFTPELQISDGYHLKTYPNSTPKYVQFPHL